MIRWAFLIALSLPAAADSSAPADGKKTVRVKACKMLLLGRILFARGSTDFAARQAPNLDELADLFRRPGLQNIVITGHVTKAEHDQTLARLRAEAILEALVKDGVDRARLTASSAPGHSRRPCVDFGATVDLPETHRGNYHYHEYVVAEGCNEP